MTELRNSQAFHDVENVEISKDERGPDTVNIVIEGDGQEYEIDAFLADDLELDEVLEVVDQ